MSCGNSIVIKYGGKDDAEFRAAEKQARKEELNIWQTLNLHRNN